MRSRTTVVLALHLAASPLAAQVAGQAATTWKITTSRSEMTDQPSVLLELQAVSPPPNVLDLPALIVRCHENTLNVYVATGSVLHSFLEDRTSVRVRWGDDAPQEAVWERSSDYTAAFAPQPRAFLQRLVGTPDFRIEVQPEGETPRVIKFDARGLERHMPTVNAACPEPQPPSMASADSAARARPDFFFMESEVDEKPAILSAPALSYPDLMRQAGIQGRVVIQAVIDPKGRAELSSISVIESPNPGLDNAALNFVRRARFRPGRVHGLAVRVLMNVPVDFKINR
jgi:TonB family protein